MNGQRFSCIFRQEVVVRLRDIGQYFSHMVSLIQIVYVYYFLFNKFSDICLVHADYLL